MDKPDVDFIEGLSPAVSIDQKSTSRNPRSTVGTITEVYDYLRLLYARAGQPHCPICGEPIAGRPRSRSSTGCWRWRRAPGSRCSRRWSAGARASTSTCSRELQSKGYSPGPGRRRRAPAHRAAEAEEAGEAHDRGGRRPAGGQGVAPSGGSPTRSRPRSGWPAGWSSSTSSTCPRTTRTASARFSEHLACLERRPVVRRARAAVVLVQLAVRRLPGVHRPRHPHGGRPRAGRARPGAHPRGGRDRARGHRRTPPSTSCRLLSALAEAMGFRIGHPVGASCRRRAQKAVLHGHDSQVHVHYRNRYGRERSYYADVRGRDPVPRAPARGDRLGLQPGAVRGLHARGALPGLRRAPGSSRRCSRSRVGGKSIAEVSGAVDRRGGGVPAPTWSCPSGSG